MQQIVVTVKAGRMIHLCSSLSQFSAGNLVSASWLGIIINILSLYL